MRQASIAPITCCYALARPQKLSYAAVFRELRLMPSTCPPKYRPDEYFVLLPLPDSRLCTGLSPTDPAGTGLPLQLATRHLSFCFRLHLEARPPLKPALEFHQQFLPGTVCWHSCLRPPADTAPLFLFRRWLLKLHSSWYSYRWSSGQSTNSGSEKFWDPKSSGYMLRKSTHCWPCRLNAPGKIACSNGILSGSVSWIARITLSRLFIDLLLIPFDCPRS